MKKIIVIGLVLLSHFAFAQKFTIKGQIMDSLSVSLPSATVMLLHAKDSSLVNFAASDVNGFFQIKNVPLGDYFLKATFVGFNNYMNRINPVAGTLEVNLGVI